MRIKINNRTDYRWDSSKRLHGPRLLNSLSHVKEVLRIGKCKQTTFLFKDFVNYLQYLIKMHITRNIINILILRRQQYYSNPIGGCFVEYDDEGRFPNLNSISSRFIAQPC